MTTETPDWLRNALASAGVPLPSVRAPREDIRPGDIRRLDPLDETDVESRLVLVEEVDEGLAYAEVTLLSSEVSMGSDGDGLLLPEESGLPYPLLVLTEIRSPVWWVQVSKLVAEVRHVPWIKDGSAGPPLTSESDPRWLWKERELDALAALASECTAELVDGSARSIVDPACLNPMLIGDGLEIAALAAVRACKAGATVLPEAALSALAGHNNVNLATASARTALNDAVSRVDGCLYIPSHQAESLQFHSRDHSGEDPLADIFADQLQQGKRNIRLLTMSTLWATDDFAYPFADASVGLTTAVIDGLRCQVVAVLADKQETAYA